MLRKIKINSQENQKASYSTYHSGYICQVYEDKQIALMDHKFFRYNSVHHLNLHNHFLKRKSSFLTITFLFFSSHYHISMIVIYIFLLYNEIDFVNKFDLKKRPFFSYKQNPSKELTAIRLIRTILTMRITITYKLFIDTNTATSTLKLICTTCWCTSYFKYIHSNSSKCSFDLDTFVRHYCHDNHHLSKTKRNLSLNAFFLIQ
jgi:hypothetical protein